MIFSPLTFVPLADPRSITQAASPSTVAARSGDPTRQLLRHIMVVGGTLLSGGRATVVGTLLGALVIQLVRYTLLANGVPDPAALVVKAGLIVLAVWLQRQEQA